MVISCRMYILLVYIGDTDFWTRLKMKGTATNRETGGASAHYLVKLGIDPLKCRY